MEKSKKNYTKGVKEGLKISSIPVVIASLCCLTPIVLVFLGISTVAFAASLSSVLFGEYGWLFKSIGVISLIISLVLYFRRKGVCTLDQAKKRRNEIINKTIIFGITAVVGYYIFFNIFVAEIGRILGIWN